MPTRMLKSPDRVMLGMADAKTGAQPYAFKELALLQAFSNVMLTSINTVSNRWAGGDVRFNPQHPLWERLGEQHHAGRPSVGQQHLANDGHSARDGAPQMRGIGGKGRDFA